MYGWRGRIGLIVPSSNTTMEPEFYKMIPAGVSVHTARVHLENVTIKELERMEEELLYAARLLATAKVDIIVFGCTTGSLIKGLGYDTKLSNMIRETVGIKAITTATAVVEALKQLNAKNIALATPYIEEVTKREEAFLEGNGFNVVDSRSLGIKENIVIGMQHPIIVYRLVKELKTNEADVVFISCTNLRTIEIIRKLELDLKKPVISSNTATLWYTLKQLNIKDVQGDYGIIFSYL